MRPLALGRRFARSQARNLVRLVRRQRVVAPPLNSATLGPDDTARARALLRDPARLGDSEAVSEFERAFAVWNGGGEAVAFASGRAALAAALAAVGASGGEVIVPAFTCRPVPRAVEAAGAEPVFCDVELETYGADAAAVERRLTAATRAIVVQHLFGLVSRDLAHVLELARGRGIAVVEDCAHAAGALVEGVRVGTLGDAGVYSSEQSKIFNTTRGGVAVARDPGTRSRLRELRGEVRPDGAEGAMLLRELLRNYRLYASPRRWLWGDVLALDRILRPAPPVDEYAGPMQPAAALIGLAQLAKLDRLNEERRRTAARWGLWAAGRGYAQPHVVPGSVPVFLRYPLLVEAERKRDPSWARAELGVDLGTWFTSLDRPEALAGNPNAAEAYARCVNLPTLGVRDTPSPSDGGWTRRSAPATSGAAGP